LLFTFICFPFALFARLQGLSLTDSLIKVLPGITKDTEKVNLLNRISFAFYGVSNDSGIKYGQEALVLALKANWKKGIAISHNSIAMFLDNKGDIEGALKHYAESGKIVEVLKDDYLLSNLRNNIGLVYLHQGNFPEALNSFNEALKLIEKLNDPKENIPTLNNIGMTYEKMANYPEALKSHFTALKLLEANGDKGGMASSLNNIGIVYMNIGNYTDALKNHQASLKLNKELNIKAGMANSYGNIGLIYYFQSNYAEALKSLDSAMVLRQELGENGDMADVLTNIAGVYQKTDSLPQALEYYFKGLKLYEAIPDKNGVAATDNNIGIVYTTQHKYKAAEEYLKKGFSLAEEIGSPDLVSDAAKALSELYDSTNQFEKSLQFYRTYVTIKDSIFSRENTRKNIQAQMQYDFDKKETLTKLEHERKLDAEKIRTLWIFIAMIVFMILATFLWITARNRKRAKEQVEMANKQMLKEKLKLDRLTKTQEELLGQKEELLIQKDELMAQLDKASQMKSRFLANISHELRTPATLLTGMLELLRDKNKNLDGNDMEKLNVAFNNSRKLQIMIEEILDLSKLENSEVKLNNARKEISPLLKRMVFAFETFIEKQNLKLEYHDEEAKGLSILVDEDKFEKVINNLIYNAIKYNRKGGNIRVNVGVSDNNRELVIEIKDTGIGIKKEDLAHVFERFYQGDSRGSKAEGVGIGLSLVKEFTLLMGGTVEVSSREGEGTSFTLKFPVVEKGQVENELDEVRSELPSEDWAHFPGRLTVLLVEDNVEMRYYLNEILGDKVNIAEAGNGREALKWLETNTADLVISDIMMPEMDGRELITNIKNDEKLRRIPLITLTALADTESQLGMLRMGVDDYIVKPFNMEELRVRVYNLLNNYYERKIFNLQPAEPEDIPAENKEAEELRKKITSYVLARLKNTNVSVYELAYDLAMSERQLYRLSKSLTGCSPAQLIKEVRLQKAYELLVSGKITKIEDVANRVGFESPGYFSRQFLERFGKRATEFL